MKKKYNNFTEFYSFYLAEHQHPNCRLLHFIGSWLVIVTFIYIFITQHWLAIILLPIFGYSCAWLGHYLYEKNHPATFKYPWYSLLADWVMFKDLLLGKIKLH